MQPITLQNILDQFRDDARNNRDLGDRFERPIQQFLRADPLYASLFSEVWMWNDWPLKGQVGNVLVADSDAALRKFQAVTPAILSVPKAEGDAMLAKEQKGKAGKKRKG